MGVALDPYTFEAPIEKVVVGMGGERIFLFWDRMKYEYAIVD